LPEDHPARRDLAPLGYEVARWLDAMTLLQTRWRKQAFASPLQAYLDRWLPSDPVGALPDVFELGLRGSWPCSTRAGRRCCICRPCACFGSPTCAPPTPSTCSSM
jgi:hypothetical protein